MSEQNEPGKLATAQIDRIHTTVACWICERCRAGEPRHITTEHAWHGSSLREYGHPCQAGPIWRLRWKGDGFARAVIASVGSPDALDAWRHWAQFVYLGGGEVKKDDKALRDGVDQEHDQIHRERRSLQSRVREAELERDAWRSRAIDAEMARR